MVSNKPKKQRGEYQLMSPEEKIAVCEKIMARYPEDHTQIPKIKAQIEKLKGGKHVKVP